MGHPEMLAGMHGHMAHPEMLSARGQIPSPMLSPRLMQPPTLRSAFMPAMPGAQMQPQMYAPQVQPQMMPWGLSPQVSMEAPAFAMRMPQMPQMWGPGPPRPGPPRSPRASSSDGRAGHPQDILRRLNGVVSEMERELCFDEDFPRIDNHYQAAGLNNAGNGSLATPRAAEDRLLLLEEELVQMRSLQDEQDQQCIMDQERIAELENNQEELQLAKEKNDQHNTILSSRAAELEESLGISHASQEKYSLQYAFQTERIQELEKLLLNAADSEDQEQLLIGEIERRMQEAEAAHQMQNHAQCETIGALEQELGRAQFAEADLLSRHEAQNNKIAQVEQLLFEAERGREQQSRQQSGHVARIAELELALTDYETSGERQSQHASDLRKRVAELDQNLAEMLDGAQSHSLRDQSHRNRIKDLEDRLAEAEVAQDTLQRQNKTTAHLLATRESELADMLSNEETQRNQQNTHRASIARLEGELEESLSASQHNNGHKKRALQLEQEMNTLLEERSQRELELDRKDRMFRKQVVELEQQLESLTKPGDLEKRLEILVQELDVERKISENARLEVQNAREDSQNIARDAELALRGAEDLRQKSAVEFEVKLQLALDRQGELEDLLETERGAQDQRLRQLQVGGAELRRSVTSHDSNRPSLKRLSLANLTSASMTSSLPRVTLTLTTPRELPVKEILPNSHHEFVLKVRRAMHSMGGTMRNLSRAEASMVANQLTEMVPNQSSDAHSALHDSQRRNACEGEIKEAAAALAAEAQNFQALQAELDVHHDLQAHEHQVVAQHINEELDTCAEQQRLLQETQLCRLGTLPRELLDELANIHHRSEVSIAELASQTSSPLHQAAEIGRRDVLEYLLRIHPDVWGLLASKDIHGRTVPELARSSGFLAMERWLREVSGEQRPLSGAPAFSDAPRTSNASRMSGFGGVPGFPDAARTSLGGSMPGLGGVPRLSDGPGARLGESMPGLGAHSVPPRVSLGGGMPELGGEPGFSDAPRRDFSGNMPGLGGAPRFSDASRTSVGGGMPGLGGEPGFSDAPRTSVGGGMPGLGGAPRFSNASRTSVGGGMPGLEGVPGLSGAPRTSLTETSSETARERNNSLFASAYRPSLMQSELQGLQQGVSYADEPDLSALPEMYMTLYQEIKVNGWTSVNWKKNYTMLHWAAGKGLRDISRHLVNIGAEPGLHDSKGRSPADMAAQAGHHELARLLDDLSTNLNRDHLEASPPLQMAPQSGADTMDTE